MGKGNSPHLILNEGFFLFLLLCMQLEGGMKETQGESVLIRTYVHNAVFSGGNAKKCHLLLSGGNAGAAACIFAAKRKRYCNCWFLEKVARHLLHSIFCIYAYLLRNRHYVCFLGVLCWNDFPHCFTNRLAQSIVTFPIGVVNNIVCRIPHYKKKFVCVVISALLVILALLSFPFLPACFSDDFE